MSTTATPTILAVDRAKAAIARGDLIAAYDETVSAIAQGDASAAIRHQQVLALARMGDTRRAMELFRSYGLDASADPHEKAVGARLLKDSALGAGNGQDRAALLTEAFEAYFQIYTDSGDTYPGINAASLAAMMGRLDAARTIADDILLRLEGQTSDYYAAVTCAEACLVTGRYEDSAQWFARSADFPSSHGDRSTTCRQIRALAAHLGFDEARAEALLAAIAPPQVIHFLGHLFREDGQSEPALRERILAALHGENIGFAYGALAAGADILVAEAVLAIGAELHVVLPFATVDFIAQSVRPAGESWVPRFEKCLETATSVTFATEMGFVGDPSQFAYGSRVAMGLATLRAQHLGQAPKQLAIWDGGTALGVGGTGEDVASWRRHGWQTIVIDPGEIDRKIPRKKGGDQPHDRVLAAMLFTDFAGFSTIAEGVLPAFWDGIMARVADVLDERGETVLSRNSWGDALYAVASSAEAAAEIALNLQSRLGEFDFGPLGIAHGGGMRIGAHFGPVYRTMDPITGRTNFYGTEVSRTARIEPVTPPGAIFVTEAFAAILALEARGAFHCQYVGRLDLAKNFGTYRMYALTRSVQ